MGSQFLTIMKVVYFFHFSLTFVHGVPPEAVSDLHVSHTHNHLTIKLTTPASPVSKPIIKFSETKENLNHEDFPDIFLNEEIEQSDLMSGNLTNPAAQEEISLHVDPFKVFKGSSKYFFAMKSQNTANELSDLSNIANITVNQAGDITPPSKIENLSISLRGDELFINFTCPGDDGAAEEAVEKISIRYSTDQSNIMDDTFHNDNLNNELEHDLSSPAGIAPLSMKANASIIFPDDGEYFFAIATADTTYNWSKVSNIFQVTYKTSSASLNSISTLMYLLPVARFFVDY